jgi:transposase
MTNEQLFRNLGEVVHEDLVAGLSEHDAALKHHIAERTIRRWLARGREDPHGPYGSFAREVDEAREDRRLPEEWPVDEAELFTAVSQAARRGNVQAQRLAWEMLKERRDGSELDPTDQIRAAPLNQRELEERKRENRRRHGSEHP